MSFVETAFARLAEIGVELKNQGHQFGEEVISLVGQLVSAEKPVAAEAEADAKQVGEDAVKAAEPVAQEAVTEVAAAVGESAQPAEAVAAEPAPAPEAVAEPASEPTA
jgi:hypothetical protein